MYGRCAARCSTSSLDAVNSRRAYLRRRSALLVTLLLGLVSTASADTEPHGLREAIARHDNDQAAISRRLYQANIPDADPQSYMFAFALADLNGDGIPDAIVYRSDRCGSGGCNLEIYRGTASGFDFVSGTTLVFRPVRVLPEHRYGRATLIVDSRYEGAVLLRYNGKRYPLSPGAKFNATEAQLRASRTVIE